MGRREELDTLLVNANNFYATIICMMSLYYLNSNYKEYAYF